jgi:type II secretory pathway predicted ATPase ExeA
VWITIATLIDALSFDLTTEGDAKIPKQSERRHRKLRGLFKRHRKTVTRFVDEANNRHPKTQAGLKRLLEVISDGRGRLFDVSSGHPKLRHDLRRTTMKKIGYCTMLLTSMGLLVSNANTSPG